jgi:L-cystine transport system permease protein
MFERIVEYFPKVLSKFPVSLYIVIVSTAIAFLIGTVLALMRIRKIPVLRQLSVLYISFIRGTPMMVQLFLIYYGFPLLTRAIFGSDLTRDWNKLIFVFIAYGFNEAGLLAENIRAAIESVSRGQTEAGYTVGLTSSQTFFRIVFPQAFKVLLPMLSAMVVGMLPATALAYMLGVLDMMGMVATISISSNHSLEGYIDAAIIFVLASVILEAVFNKLIKKQSYGTGTVVGLAV